MRVRMDPVDRKRQIAITAHNVAKQDGLASLSWRAVADACGVSHGTIRHHFGTPEALREEVVRLAVAWKTLSIIAQGLIARSPAAMAAPERLKQAALNQATE